MFGASHGREQEKFLPGSILINLDGAGGIPCLQISSSSIVVHTGSKEEEFHCRFQGFIVQEYSSSTLVRIL
jgi:hypothetical protein